MYVRMYILHQGMPVVTSVTWDGQQTLSCNSSGGPATYVTWRRNCAVLPNNDTYLQTRTVTQGQTATYNNTLVIDPAPPSGVYTCSVTNIRGYSNGAVGVGGKGRSVKLLAQVIHGIVSFLQTAIVLSCRCL